MKRKFLKNNNTDFLITIIVGLLMIVLPIFLKNDYLLHIACLIGINILIALGMHVVTGLAGQINMGQYGFYCIGAYSSALITTKLELPFLVSLILTIIISILFGVLVGIPSLKVEGPYLSLCTIGFAESFRLIINSASWAGKANGVTGIPKLDFFGIQMDSKIKSYYFIMVFAFVGILLVNNLMHSNFGKRFSAIKDDPLAASVVGVNVRKVKILAFILCAVFAGIAGSLYSNYSGYVAPTTFVQALQTNFLLMIVLGGLGNIWGAVIGASLVTVIYEYTRAYVEFQKMAFGIAMVLVVLFLRRGIVGTIKHYSEEKRIVKQHENQMLQDGSED